MDLPIREGGRRPLPAEHRQPNVAAAWNHSIRQTHLLQNFTLLSQFTYPHSASTITLALHQIHRSQMCTVPDSPIGFHQP